ncbi:hypothetical protein MHBO_004442, partial [Bonamia ostreae]
MIISLLKSNIEPHKISKVAKIQSNRCYFRQKGFDFYHRTLRCSPFKFNFLNLIGNFSEWLSSDSENDLTGNCLSGLDSCFYKNVSGLLKSFDQLVSTYLQIGLNSENIIKVLALMDIFSINMTHENCNLILRENIIEILFENLSNHQKFQFGQNEDFVAKFNVIEKNVKMNQIDSPPSSPDSSKTDSFENEVFYKNSKKLFYKCC